MKSEFQFYLNVLLQVDNYKYLKNIFEYSLFKILYRPKPNFVKFLKFEKCKMGKE